MSESEVSTYSLTTLVKGIWTYFRLTQNIYIYINYLEYLIKAGNAKCVPKRSSAWKVSPSQARKFVHRKLFSEGPTNKGSEIKFITGVNHNIQSNTDKYHGSLIRRLNDNLSVRKYSPTKKSGQIGDI